MSDKELLSRLRRDDESAVETAIERYGAYVAAVVHNALGRLSCPEDIEELASDVFFTLWQKRGTLRSGDSLRPWLAAVARNRVRSHLRNLGEVPAEVEKLPELSATDTEDLVSRREKNRALAVAVEALGEPDAEIFIRRYYRGETVPEIASAVGLPPENIKTRLRRGRAKLKKLLEKGGCEL